jgi:hypothetical protein
MSEDDIPLYFLQKKDHHLSSILILKVKKTFKSKNKISAVQCKRKIF